MKTFLLIALFVLSSCLTPEDAFQQFQQFITKYDKHYSSLEEYMARFKVFADSLKRPHLGMSYKTGITKFSDMTRQEFRKTYLNLDFNALAGKNVKPAKFVSNGEAPEELDYIKEGYLLGVKDQGSCGSCYAFGVIANIEGQYYKKYKKNKQFSEQMIVDCDIIDSGCNGGLMEYTFRWLYYNGGIMSMEDYPYKGVKQKCQSDQSKYDPDAVVVDYQVLGDPSGSRPVDEEELKEFLYATGPLTVGINAEPLQYYNSGIINLSQDECDPSGMNHAVTLVGYGVSEGTPYWLVRNSWGENWGEEGYFRVYRGNGVCGINDYITTGELK